MAAIDPVELRARAYDGVRGELVAFANGSAEAELLERDGVTASLSPLTPDRSLFNSVHYESAERLEACIDELAEAYRRAGVRAWCVWVPDDDPRSAELLAARDHVLDAAPRLMALELSDLAPAPPLPAGARAGPIDASAAATLNDQAYGHSAPAFAAALSSADSGIRWLGAFRDDQPIGCVGAIDLDDDCDITGVATLAAERGHGIAGHLVTRALEDARDARGCRTGSLQATRDGAPVYGRLGFRDLGYAQMWEHRVSAPALG